MTPQLDAGRDLNCSRRQLTASPFRDRIGTHAPCGHSCLDMGAAQSHDVLDKKGGFDSEGTQTTHRSSGLRVRLRVADYGSFKMM